MPPTDKAAAPWLEPWHMNPFWVNSLIRNLRQHQRRTSRGCLLTQVRVFSLDRFFFHPPPPGRSDKGQRGLVLVWCGRDEVCRVLVTRTILVFPSDGASLRAIHIWGGDHLQNNKNNSQVIKHVQNNCTSQLKCLYLDFSNTTGDYNNTSLAEKAPATSNPEDKLSIKAASLLQKINEKDIHFFSLTTWALWWRRESSLLFLLKGFSL